MCFALFHLLPMPPLDSANTHILLVEDDDDAVVLIQRLLKRAGIGNPVDVARDGEQAISFLQACVDGPGLPLPGLVLLDLKLPRTDGFEVLKWIRSIPALANLRIIIMSSSNRAQDIERAKELGASSYLEKFPPASQLAELLQWSSYMGLPNTINSLRDASTPPVKPA